MGVAAEPEWRPEELPDRGFGIQVVIGPEVDEFFRGEFVRRRVTKRPAGGQRPDVDEQPGDELVVGERRVDHGMITLVRVRDR